MGEQIDTKALGADLTDAVDQGYYADARALLAQGADPNIADVDGDTPLDHARFHLRHCYRSDKEEIELIELLIAHGAKGKDGPSQKEQSQQAANSRPCIADLLMMK